MGKYWDIKPPKKKEAPKFRIAPVVVWSSRHNSCLHRNCTNCLGTGRGPIGPCIHMISCPCPSCSPTFLVGSEKSLVEAFRS